MIDRDKFFPLIRSKPFNGHLDQSQVDGINSILDTWEKEGYTDIRHLSYELGTVYHECAAQMVPISEYGQGRGRPYGKPDPITHQTYYGRGYVQLTWKSNYVYMSTITGEDLVNHPELALVPSIAAQIMFIGMEKGTFTGKKLNDYFTDEKSDWYHARQIINGLDRAQTIATYAQEFHAALT
jgi:putative chitinase